MHYVKNKYGREIAFERKFNHNVLKHFSLTINYFFFSILLVAKLFVRQARLYRDSQLRKESQIIMIKKGIVYCQIEFTCKPIDRPSVAGAVLKTPSHVTCHLIYFLFSSSLDMYICFFFFPQSGEASWGKYQNCHLVLKGSFWFYLVFFWVL